MRLRRMTALSFYELSRAICVHRTRPVDCRAIIAWVDVAETQSGFLARKTLQGLVFHHDLRAVYSAYRCINNVTRVKVNKRSYQFFDLFANLSFYHQIHQ